MSLIERSHGPSFWQIIKATRHGVFDPVPH
jgi:hypothetical protein